MFNLTSRAAWHGFLLGDHFNKVRCFICYLYNF
jgi:hypothetical protein